MAISFQLRMLLCSSLALSACAVELERVFGRDAGSNDDSTDHKAIDEDLSDDEDRETTDDSLDTNIPRLRDAGPAKSPRKDGGTDAGTRGGRGPAQPDASKPLPQAPELDDATDTLAPGPSDTPPAPTHIDAGLGSGPPIAPRMPPPSTEPIGVIPLDGSMLPPITPTPDAGSTSTPLPDPGVDRSPPISNNPNTSNTQNTPNISNQPNTQNTPNISNQPSTEPSKPPPPPPPPPIPEICTPNAYTDFAAGFFTKYCTLCHGSTASGPVPPLTSSTLIEARKDAVRTRVIAPNGMPPMPPSGMPQPSADEKVRLEEWLTCKPPR